MRSKANREPSCLFFFFLIYLKTAFNYSLHGALCAFLAQSFSTKSREAVLDRAFPAATWCDAENSHPLQSSGLCWLHADEAGYFSTVKTERQLSLLANEGREARMHCASRHMSSPGRPATGSAPAAEGGRDTRGPTSVLPLTGSGHVTDTVTWYVFTLFYLISR